MKRPVCPGVQTRHQCAQCDSALARDDIAISRRLIGRGISQFYCIRCLAARLGVSQAVIHLKIKEYRAMGCALFPPYKEG